jgi:hypothetical protein
VAPELVVGERLFHQPLAVVEGAADRDGLHVVAHRGHLRLLDVADLARRIQDQHARVRHPVERLRHRTARIARGRDEDGQRRPVGEVVQQTRLRARSDVLERQRRPMEELEGPNSIGHLHERHREVERAAAPGLSNSAGRSLSRSSGPTEPLRPRPRSRPRSDATVPGGSGSSRSGM